MSQDAQLGQRGAGGSPLRELCEDLRLRLLSIISPESPVGAPVFGPVLIFLEDPRQGVLRPATKVEWDELRLESVLNDLLATALSRLTSLRNALADPANAQASEAFAEKYRDVTKSHGGKVLSEAVSAVVGAWEAVNNLLSATDAASASGITHSVDDVLRPEAVESLSRSLEAATNLVDPLFKALSGISSAHATVLGAPGGSRWQSIGLGQRIRFLASTTSKRFQAWLDLRQVVDSLTDKQIGEYDDVVDADNPLVTEGFEGRCLLRDFKAMPAGTTSAVAFRSAIRLFQVGPQEVGSSLGYMMLHFRHVSEQLKGEELRDFDLSALAFRPGRRQSKHGYSDELVKESPLYRVTHRLERLFYGGMANKKGEQPSTIENIVFVPIRYFDGQVIGQVVVIPPFQGLNLRLVLDACGRFLAEIGPAVQGEFVRMIQLQMRTRLFGHHKDALRVDRDAVVRVVAESITSLVSVRSIVALRYELGRAEHCRVLYAARRKGRDQPSDLVLSCVGESSALEMLPGREKWSDEASGLTPERFIETGLIEIKPSRRQLETSAIPNDATVALAGIEKAYKDLMRKQRITARGGTCIAYRREHHAVDGPSDRTSESDTTYPELFDELSALHEQLTSGQEMQFAPVSGTSLLLWVPLEQGTRGAVVDEYAVFALECWEPPSLVERMQSALLTTVRVGVESCNTFLLELASTLAAEKASVGDLYHALSSGSDFLKFAARLQGVDMEALESGGHRHKTFAAGTSNQESMFYERAGMVLRNQERWAKAQAGDTKGLEDFLFDPTLPAYRVRDLIRNLLSTSWSLAMGRTHQQWSADDPVVGLSDSLGETSTAVHWLGPASYVEELARNNHRRKRTDKVRLFALWGMTSRLLSELADGTGVMTFPPNGQIPPADANVWSLVYADDDDFLIPPHLFSVEGGLRHTHAGTHRLAALALATSRHLRSVVNKDYATLLQFPIDRRRLEILAGRTPDSMGLGLMENGDLAGLGERIPYQKIVAAYFPMA